MDGPLSETAAMTCPDGRDEKGQPMSAMTSNAVRAAWEVLGRDTGYRTTADLEDAITAEAERLDDLIWDLTQRLRDQGITQYRQAHRGAHPPFLETVQIGNRARSQAEELILYQELGEATELAVIQEDEDTVGDESWRDSPDRWKDHTDLLDVPTPEIDALTDEVWPERTIRFRVMAAYLMQTRYEDSQPIPQTPDDPLKVKFTDAVDAELDRMERVLSEYQRTIADR